ncbi:MAG TPA: accessory factor UbiK family protein [Leucothrix sp.]|nr:accessory factor UbiK family protein [Leucothrix sp.]
MENINQIDDIAKKLAEFMPASLQNLQSDIKRNMQGSLESSLRKMNLVTREEFEIQTAVLLRTREKLEALEKVVKQLENKK